MRTLVLCLAALLLSGAEHHGQVKFGGLPVPGATVTATQGDKTLTAITDPQGAYSFPDLADGVWTTQVEMPGFEPIRQDVTISAGAPSSDWDLKMLPLSEIKAVAAPASPPAPQASGATSAATQSSQATNQKPRNKKKAPPAPTNTTGAFQRADVNAANPNAAASPAATSDTTPPANETFANQSPAELNQRAADGLLINGTANNGASSPFALGQAFGNNRRGVRSLYSGNIGIIVDDSPFDARPYSVTGQDTPRLTYDRLTGVFAFGGPFKIPHLVRNGPMFFVNYQWTRNRNDSTTPGLMPTLAERNGDFSQVLNPLGQPIQLINPATGVPIPGNMIPASEISPQAEALLRLFPLPNFSGDPRYNYQIPIINNMHQDSLQSRLFKTIGNKNQFSGLFSLQSTRSDTPNLFGFLDTTDSLGLNVNANWRHNFTSRRLFTNFGVQFSRFASHATPYFENRDNVSCEAGISGNNQDPVNWGPPALNFAGSGISNLSDGLPSFTRYQTSGVSTDNLWSRGRHNISFGGDFRRQEFNVLSQQNPRGTFTFTGASAGFDFADFLLGVPDTSSISFGNADKYFRSSIYDAYVTDDWRVSPGFTLNPGVRWEYWSPITEKYNRLVNLDIAPGFAGEAPVLASNPTGSLTGESYPNSLIHPDKGAVQPRIGLSWRPLPASSMVVRAGYGVYYNTSVYLPLVTQMAQQYPLSGPPRGKSLSVQNSPSDPLTLANGFNASPTITPDTFAIDPNFRIGYSQNWQLSVQRDLPWALVATVAYLGSKGTRAEQMFYPNTYPSGAVNPCPTCPAGFLYVTSNGNSTREAAQFQLRRRLQSGFTASLQYTYSKSIDDAALGGSPLGIQGTNQGGAPPTVVAQNWLDLAGERGLSNFDQRHLLVLQGQYTTGMGIGGGTLVNGWKGALFKEWTVGTQLTAGTGLPLTPIYPAAVAGTGFTGSIRPEYTGAPLYNAPAGLNLNPAAYIAPLPGEWGNAGRNSITGPAQFSVNASLGRVFQMTDRLSLDFRVDATNALNNVTYPSWNTVVTSANFGLPPNANPMRILKTTIRLRF